MDVWAHLHELRLEGGGDKLHPPVFAIARLLRRDLFQTSGGINVACNCYPLSKLTLLQ